MENSPREYYNSENIWPPNASALKLIKETLMQLKSHSDPNTVIASDINTPFSPTDRSSRETLNRSIGVK